MTNQIENMTENISTEVYAGEQPSVTDRLLLICNSAGKIVFAAGDFNSFFCKIHQLQNRNLFEIGFTQKSLDFMRKQQSERDFLKPKNRRGLRAEMVNSNEEMATEEKFNLNKENYLKKIILNFSFLKAKFGPFPAQYIESKAEKSTSQRNRSRNQRQHKNQYQFTLVEVILQDNQNQFFSNFADYTCARKKLPQLEPVYSQFSQ